MRGIRRTQMSQESLLAHVSSVGNFGDSWNFLSTWWARQFQFLFVAIQCFVFITPESSWSPCKAMGCAGCGRLCLISRGPERFSWRHALEVLIWAVYLASSSFTCDEQCIAYIETESCWQMCCSYMLMQLSLMQTVVWKACQSLFLRSSPCKWGVFNLGMNLFPYCCSAGWTNTDLVISVLRLPQVPTRGWSRSCFSNFAWTKRRREPFALANTAAEQLRMSEGGVGPETLSGASLQDVGRLMQFLVHRERDHAPLMLPLRVIQGLCGISNDYVG